ncbi:MAG: alanine:cation symporter family protein, partial [Phascolarctobacterium sp.]|nr:alanine:cation symporter family protein [Phascolarctobacterium sp.]
LAIMIILFAFSSIVGNYYYGDINMPFICESKSALNIYRAMVVGMVMFGSVAEVPFVWNLADLFMALMAIVNLVAITRLSKYAYIALNDYLAQKRAGVLEPEFDPSVMPEQKGIFCWGNENK